MKCRVLLYTAASRRHIIELEEVWKMKITTNNSRDIMDIAHAAAYVAIRARHQASGLKFLDQLNRMQNADRRRRMHRH